MGEPRLEWQEIPLKKKSDTLHLAIESGPLKDPIAVSMGNPHMVFFVPDIEAINIVKLGPELEHHPLFPERANVGIAHIESRERISLKVWERGAGLTLACGTGACAALVAASLRGLTGRKAQVKLPGGALFIEWREDDNHVLMTGPAAVSFKGEIDSESYRLK
jgi:diaminopimelate epimerase